MNGAFIVLEGPDGAGKTTQASLLVAELRARGRELVFVREPGGTAIGEKVRQILLDPANEAMDVRTELFLYMASRAQLCREVIAPALAGGRIVVADRFLASSAVYQGVAGGIGMEEVLAVGRIATGGIEPDLTLLLDIEAEEAAARVSAARSRDRIERKSPEYHARVCAGYRDFARLSGGRVRVIDGARAVEAVTKEVLDAVLEVLA